MTENLEIYLTPADYIDSDHPAVIEFAETAVAGIDGPVARAVALYNAVRDDIVYTPYCDFNDPETYRASSCLVGGIGFCQAKAALLAAAARAVGIPARVGYADVQNHLTSPRLRDLMGTDTFAWHGYVELFLEGRWVKSTPAFDTALCQKYAIHALDFDGRNDSLFHPFDTGGRKHMEYKNDRGTFADVPVAAVMADFRRLYPKLMAAEGSLHQEAGAGS